MIGLRLKVSVQNFFFYVNYSTRYGYFTVKSRDIEKLIINKLFLIHPPRPFSVDRRF